MNWQEFFNSFDFKNDFVLHQKIEAVHFAELKAVIVNGDRLFDEHVEASLSEFVSEARFVDAFK